MKKIVGFIFSILLLLTFSTSLDAQSLNHIGLMPTIDHSGSISKKWDYSLYYFGMANLYNDEVNSISDKSNLFVFYNALPFSQNDGGMFYFEVQGNRLDAKWIRRDSVVADQFTILKDAGKMNTITPNGVEAR